MTPFGLNSTGMGVRGRLLTKVDFAIGMYVSMISDIKTEPSLVYVHFNCNKMSNTRHLLLFSKDNTSQYVSKRNKRPLRGFFKRRQKVVENP